MKTTATVAITMKTADAVAVIITETADAAAVITMKTESAVAAITMEKGNAATMAMALHRKRNKEGKHDIYH